MIPRDITVGTHVSSQKMMSGVDWVVFHVYPGPPFYINVGAPGFDDFDIFDQNWADGWVVGYVPYPVGYPTGYVPPVFPVIVPQPVVVREEVYVPKYKLSDRLSYSKVIGISYLVINVDSDQYTLKSSDALQLFQLPTRQIDDSADWQLLVEGQPSAGAVIPIPVPVISPAVVGGEEGLLLMGAGLYALFGKQKHSRRT